MASQLYSKSELYLQNTTLSRLHHSHDSQNDSNIFRLFLVSDRRHKVVIPGSKDITIMHYNLYQASYPEKNPSRCCAAGI
jgi:hypothetical protein